LIRNHATGAPKLKNAWRWGKSEKENISVLQKKGHPSTKVCRTMSGDHVSPAAGDEGSTGGWALQQTSKKGEEGGEDPALKENR